MASGKSYFCCNGFNFWILRYGLVDVDGNGSLRMNGQMVSWHCRILPPASHSITKWTLNSVINFQIFLSKTVVFPQSNWPRFATIHHNRENFRYMLYVRVYLCISVVILFNGGHILQLRLETVAIRRWMRNGVMIMMAKWYLCYGCYMCYFISSNQHLKKTDKNK